MLTTLTSWLRPSSARRHPRSGDARLRAVEHLEDRVTPDTTAHSLATYTYNQDWSSPSSYQSDWTASTQTSAQGFIGAGLTPATVGNAGTVTGSAGDLFLDLNGALVAASDYGSSGVALFHPVQTGNNPTVALKPTTNSSPYLLFNLNTTNVADVFVDFRLRDIDTSANAAVQTFALQWRPGNAGAFTTVGAVIPDATNGADIFVARRLPAGASGLPLVQVRLITTTPAAGLPAEWIGVDDITIRGNRGPTVTPSGVTPTYQEPLSPTLTNQILVDPGMTVTDTEQAVFFDNVA